MAATRQQGISRIWRTIGIVARRRKLVPAIEYATLAWFILSMIGTYLVLSGGKPGQDLLTPPLVGLLLLANLVPAIALLVLIGRRAAYARAAKTPLAGPGLLHSRLVGLFSTIAAVPVLLLVIFASLLFQYGFDFWYSQKARGIFENANTLAQTYYREKQQAIINETEVMAGDINLNLGVAPIQSDEFQSSFGFQVYQRGLSQGAILRITPKLGVQSLAIADRGKQPPMASWIPQDVVKTLLEKRQTVFRDAGKSMEAVTPVPDRPDLYVYASRVDDSAALAQTKRFSTVLDDYNSLLDRSRMLQLQFHAALFLIALIVVGAAVVIALNVADRVVKPVGDLVGAARRVSAGDLSARVNVPQSRDEIGALASAFNQMTQRLETQRHELINANSLLDRRRALIEAVLSSVSAGVIAVSDDRHIRIINSRAEDILRTPRGQGAGKELGSITPELSDLLDRNLEAEILEIVSGGESRTLAVQVVTDEGGKVMTFDDITDQLADQRRAAWSDVARRIAHEIKNPLTPIQLAAERLKRRFAKDEPADPAMVGRLTDTIVRQVGDLRRMVDEFSSFARMPKPVFQEESLVEICRQSLFLHEVAHSEISFSLRAPDVHPLLICDRRQLGQAFTNIIKNGVEAIEQKIERDGPMSGDGRHTITMTVAEQIDGSIDVAVADTGIGLPAERGRIVEPYMTTRRSGTGLGLAIVKKIAEDHGGSICFGDRVGGGTVVTMSFRPAELRTLAKNQDNDLPEVLDVAPSNLTRTEGG
jgi:two-component system, NtrC family, nitrogen regulation sensor histidine kinase NtrY